MSVLGLGVVSVPGSVLGSGLWTYLHAYTHKHHPDLIPPTGHAVARHSAHVLIGGGLPITKQNRGEKSHRRMDFKAERERGNIRTYIHTCIAYLQTCTQLPLMAALIPMLTGLKTRLVPDHFVEWPLVLILCPSHTPVRRTQL